MNVGLRQQILRATKIAKEYNLCPLRLSRTKQARTVEQQIEELFIKIDRTSSKNGCQFYGPPSATHRYSQVWFGNRIWPTHRLIFILANGPIDDDIEVCHDCPGKDDSMCVNLDHLFIGTHKENVQDSVRKGRGIGLRNVAYTRPSSRTNLTLDQLREIRNRYAQGGITQTELAQLYKASKNIVHRLVTGQTWKFL